MPDSLVYFGGAIKALDENGKVGGYLVRFSDSGKSKDLSGEYFTSKTFLGSRDGDGVDTIFHHGQPLPVKANLTKAAAAEIDALRDHVFAPVKTRRDAIGIIAETILDMSDEYEKAVFGLVKANKLGWSSGAVGHLVRKSSDGQITRWPIGEASMTPCPCEPLNRAITMKSFDALKFVSVIEGDDDEDAAPIPNKPSGLAAKLNQHIDDLADDKGRSREAIIGQMAKEASIKAEHVNEMLAGKMQIISGQLHAFARVLNVDFEVLKSATRRDHLQTIKGMFEDALAGDPPQRWQLESVYCCVVKKLAAAAGAAQMAGVEFDLSAKLTEATDEYAARLNEYALSEITEWMSEGGDDDFYLKAMVNPSKDALSEVQIDLSDHSQLVETAGKGILKRLRAMHAARIKAGRVLSDKNRKLVQSLEEGMIALAGELRKLLDESQPMASETEKRAALTKHLVLKKRQRELMGASL